MDEEELLISTLDDPIVDSDEEDNNNNNNDDMDQENSQENSEIHVGIPMDFYVLNTQSKVVYCTLNKKLISKKVNFFWREKVGSEFF